MRTALQHLFRFSPKDDAGSDGDLQRDADALRQANAADPDDAPDPARARAAAKPETITDAGKKYLESLPPEDREREFSDEELHGAAGDGEPDDEVVERRRAAEGEDAADEIEDEPIVRETDGAEWTKVGNGYRWVLDGKFVDGEPPEEWEAPKAAAPAKAPAAPDKGDKGKEKEKAEKVVKLKLAGDAKRGEEDIEVEVDEELAERIRRAQKGALRREEYSARKKDLDARQAEMDATDLALEQDPVGFIINQLGEGRRLDVAKALLITHLPELRDTLEEYLGDEVARLTAKDKLRDSMQASSKKLDQAKLAREHAQRCLDVAESLIPEDTEDDVAQEFMLDARRILGDASRAGTRVTPEAVKELLARRVKLYGFDAARAPARPAGSSARGRPNDARTARPVSDRARQIAERAAPTRAEAAAAQARIRRVQDARRASQRQAPAGAGAAPTQVPILTPAEESDVRSASKALRQKGLPSSWTPTQ